VIANHDIRLATLADAAGIGEMSRDLIEHGLGWRWTPARIRRCLGDTATNVAVATSGDRERIAGFAIMRYKENEAHLILLGVGEVLAEATLLGADPGEVPGGGVRHLANHGEHRSLGRVADRLIGGVGRAGERGADEDRIDEVARPGRQLLGGPAHDLAEDHPRVPARPHQRGAGDGMDELVAVGLLPALGLDPIEFGEDGPHRQRHVVPGVAVRHGKDVEVVDLLAAGLEV
jgi:hypothetical protein